jgi:hypothetical protein
MVQPEAPYRSAVLVAHRGQPALVTSWPEALATVPPEGKRPSAPASQPTRLQTTSVRRLCHSFSCFSHVSATARDTSEHAFSSVAPCALPHPQTSATRAERHNDLRIWWTPTDARQFATQKDFSVAYADVQGPVLKLNLDERSAEQHGASLTDPATLQASSGSHRA